MPATIAASTSKAAVIAAQRIRAVLLQGLEFLWQLRIADFIRIEVQDRNTHSVFYFAFAEIVQQWPPLFVFFEILGDMLGKQNVPSIPAFHHPLRYIQTCSREIRATSHIDHTTDRTAVYSHAEL